MTSPIKPWLSQAEAQRLLCELADATLDAAQRKRERDILQHALDEATAERDRLKEELAALMIRHSFVTGHGDTISNLLDELDWQLSEDKARNEA